MAARVGNVVRKVEDTGRGYRGDGDTGMGGG